MEIIIGRELLHHKVLKNFVGLREREELKYD